MNGVIAEMLKDSPALLWPCDGKTSAAAVKDISGNGRDGSMQGTITGPSAPILPGSVMGSLGFGGTGNNDYIHRAYEAGLDVGTGDFAWEFWCVCTNGTSNYVEICGRDNDSAGKNLVRLHTGDGNVEFWIGGSHTGSNNPLSDGKLHHLVCQRVGTHGQIYLDNVLEADTAGMSGDSNHASDVRLGTIDGTLLSLVGNVGPFAYYTASLSASRVAAHYAAGHREGVIV
jgi:hypothetical protein